MSTKVYKSRVVFVVIYENLKKHMRDLWKTSWLLKDWRTTVQLDTLFDTLVPLIHYYFPMPNENSHIKSSKHSSRFLTVQLKKGYNFF